MRSFSACTIVSNNYLAFAKVFAESYREHHPEAAVYVCIVDRPHPSIQYSALPFETIFAEDLGIDAFRNLALRYNQLELNTAVKPFLLSYLRDRYGLDGVYYFDPDIRVLDRLDDLHSALERSQLLLTPHITEPLDNEYLPGERTIRMAGIYNLGFLGLRFTDATAAFLDWWGQRLYRFCLEDSAQGLFVDQSWMDFAPAMLDDVGIVRSPRHNIAYWNLAGRPVRRVGGEWRVGDQRVGFFHFSGVDLGNLEPLSKHQDRLSLADLPALRPLFEEYRLEVLGAGMERFLEVPYAFQEFAASGVPIPPVARRLLLRTDPYGRRWPDPFELCSEDSFFSWLVEPLECERGSLNRVALTLWEERRDLLEHFPDVCGADLPAFVDWLVGHGEGERAGLAPVFLEAVRVRDPGEAEPSEGTRFDFQHYPYDALVAQSPDMLLRRLDLRQPGSLTAWLNDPIPGTADPDPPITRLALMLFFDRPDLQEAFPDPLGADQRDFAYWFCHHGAQEYRLDESLTEPVARALLATVNLRRPRADSTWLNIGRRATAGSRPRLTRLAVLLHRASRSLRRTFPDAFGDDREEYAEWLAGDGARAFRLHRKLVAGLRPDYDDLEASSPWQRVWRRMFGRAGDRSVRRGPAGTDASASELTSVSKLPAAGRMGQPPTGGPEGRRHPAAARGVNLLGSLESPSGVGQVGRGSVAALEAAGVPLARVALDQYPLGRAVGGRLQQPEGVPYAVNLLHSNADQIRRSTGMLPTAVAAGYTVGYWFWELAHFPLAFADSFAHLDELWAPSEFCRASYESLSTVPVRLVEPCVPRPERLAVDRERLGLDSDRFYFFYSFDVLSVPGRKNPLGVIHALKRLCRVTDRRVGLVLKVTRAASGSDELLAELYEESLGQPIRLHTADASRRDMDELINACDACLSLHRSEGLGLLPIEFLYLEKPVVATAYGGLMDFFDETIGFPVGFELVRLGRDHPPYPREAVWAEPDLAHAVESMRRVVEEPLAAQARAVAGRRRVESLYGLESAAKRFKAELDRIFEAVAPAPRVTRPAEQATATVSEGDGR